MPRSRTPGNRGRSHRSPGRMSVTRTVPASVPSLCHSSWPCTPSFGREVQRPAHGRQVVGIGAERIAVVAGARPDVLDQDGAGRGAVALPQLLAGGPVVGREEQRPAHGRQAGGIGAAREAVGAARVDVLDQDGAGLGPVALPQLPAVASVSSAEKNSVPPTSVKSPGKELYGKPG